MPDVLFLAATVAIFALVALVAKGVEKLGPPVGTLSPRTAAPATRISAAQPTAPAIRPGSAPAATPEPAHESGDRS